MKIKLSDDVSMDLEKLIESRMVIQANSGGGKTTTVRRFIEQSFGHKQIIILDPEGEYGNMRGKFDFVYAGKGGDAPVESRSAALLARRLLELKASAIIDLYELQMQDRKHFVKLFFESVINSPKELWHDCFFILDEADIFAPEKRESESLQSVIDMAGRGRKRGYCLIPASRRPAQLNKDVSAECNNKLIGRASQDIDRKRSAEELGFTTKEQIISLRQLEPGEFYCFGPAISHDVIKTKIGEISVQPPKRGQNAKAIPLPSAKVKKILGQLADLPKEAAEEAKTNAELKAQIAALKIANNTFARNAIKITPPVDLQKRANEIAEMNAIKTSWRIDREKTKEVLSFLQDFVKKGQKILSGGTGEAITISTVNIKEIVESIPKSQPARLPFATNERSLSGFSVFLPKEENGEKKLNDGEMKILNAIAQDEEGISMEHLAIITGYKKTSRVVYTNNLIRAGLISRDDRVFRVTPAGTAELGDNFTKLPTGSALRDHMLQTLPDGERKIFSIIADRYPGPASREDLLNLTEYKKTSIVVYGNKLIARKLVNRIGSAFYMNSKLAE